jgi:type III restriction enzyme
LQGAARCYARNDQLGFRIPYEYLNVSHFYEPDYLVELNTAKGKLTLILEIKGYSGNQENAKHDAVKRWVKAVNNWGQLGQWDFHVCSDPQLLERELKEIASL